MITSITEYLEQVRDTFKHLEISLSVDTVFKGVESRKIGGVGGTRRRCCHEKLLSKRKILRQ